MEHVYFLSVNNQLEIIDKYLTPDYLDRLARLIVPSMRESNPNLDDIFLSRRLKLRLTNDQEFRLKYMNSFVRDFELRIIKYVDLYYIRSDDINNLIKDNIDHRLFKHVHWRTIFDNTIFESDPGKDLEMLLLTGTISRKEYNKRTKKYLKKYPKKCPKKKRFRIKCLSKI